MNIFFYLFLMGTPVLEDIWHCQKTESKSLVFTNRPTQNLNERCNKAKLSKGAYTKLEGKNFDDFANNLVIANEESRASQSRVNSNDR